MYRPREKWAERILARAGAFLHLRRDDAPWKGLLELEETGSAAERHLLLIREFTHLASDALTTSPSKRRSWPHAERIATLHSAAMVLLSCATDQANVNSNGTEADNTPVNAALITAIQTLVRYLALQQALQQAPVLDPEPMRLLAREHSRLRMALDETTEWLRNS